MEEQRSSRVREEGSVHSTCAPELKDQGGQKKKRHFQVAYIKKKEKCLYAQRALEYEERAELQDVLEEILCNS